MSKSQNLDDNNHIYFEKILYIQNFNVIQSTKKTVT